MEPLDPRLLSWLAKVREDLGAPASAPPDDPLQGCSLDGARIGKLLGVGSFSVVFELLDPNSSLPLAVKVLERTSGSASDVDKEDEIFRREVDIGMRLDHPTITRIHRFAEKARSRFVVLDLVRGKTWHSLAGQAISAARFRELFAPLAQGLSYAHKMGVVHRDLKPENVMIAEDGGVRILDFGMARQSGGTDVTVTGQFKGTPMYCAPEQIIDSKKVGPACDQFSFGLLSFQLLTGQFPYALDPKQPLHTLFIRLQQPAARLRSVWPQASTEADDVMAKILAMKPEDRYSSVQEAFEALSSSLPS